MLIYSLITGGGGGGGRDDTSKSVIVTLSNLWGKGGGQLPPLPPAARYGPGFQYPLLTMTTFLEIAVFKDMRNPS